MGKQDQGHPGFGSAFGNRLVRDGARLSGQGGEAHRSVSARRRDRPERADARQAPEQALGPSRYRYGTSGAGGVGGIALALLLGGAGVDVQKIGRVELQGGAGLLDAVATGESHFAAQYLAEMGPQLASEKLKPLAVSTAQR